MIPTVETWYQNLTSYCRKDVKVIGGPEKEHGGFWPDG